MSETDQAGGSTPPPNFDGIPVFMKQLSGPEVQSLTSTQKGFTISIRSLDSSLYGDALRTAIAELFPPASLFGKEICDMPAVWVDLQNFLNARGAPMAQHHSRRVIMTVAHGIYEDAEDRTAAVEMALLIFSAGRRIRPELRPYDASPPLSPTPSGLGEGNNDGAENLTRLAHNVAMGFKDSKFAGELGECWMEYVDEYSQIARNYGLTPEQKFQFLHKLFKKEAKRFYDEHVQMYAQNYQQAVYMMNTEYNSPVLQARVKNYLSELRVSDIEKSGLKISQALSNVYKLIAKLSRQVPPSNRGDAHKIEFIRKATVGYTWAVEPLSRVATQRLSFQQLYREIEAALQLQKEGDIALERDHAANPRSPVKRDDSLEVPYAGQGRYALNLRDIRSKHQGSSDLRKEPLYIAGCFNCGVSHMMKDCKIQINAGRAAAKRLEYYKKKDATKYAVHLVLADICRHVDASFADIGVTNHQSDDTEILQVALQDDYPTNDVKIFQLAMDKNLQKKEMNFSLPELGASSDSEKVEILVLNHSWPQDTPSDFQGACVDSGAQRTVIGYRQSEFYCNLVKTRLKPQKDDEGIVFIFGETTQNCIGQVEIRIPVADHILLTIEADVVDVDVPFLLGLDMLTSARLILDFADDRVISKEDDWSVPFVRKNGHVYIEWEVNKFFTVSKLRKEHRHFYHPQPGKLNSMMRREDSSTVSPNVMGDLEKINETCDVFQREADAPHRFRVSIPDANCVFNRTVYLDLIYLDGDVVLHIVDKDTKFNSACFLKGESTAEVWEAFMLIWVTKYVGFPKKMAFDQGPQFESLEWANLFQDAGISKCPSGFESHNAIGEGERYHYYLRRVFNKVRTDNPDIKPACALQIAVKAVNDTAGPAGLVPTLLVFGVLPCIPIAPKEIPKHDSRMKAMSDAGKEMTRLVHQTRISTAMRSNVLSAADTDYTVGQEVLMYREKPIGKWIGPYIVKSKDGKMLSLDTGDLIVRVSVDKIKLYRDDPELSPASEHITNPEDVEEAENGNWNLLLDERDIGLGGNGDHDKVDQEQEELVDIMRNIRDAETSPHIGDSMSFPPLDFGFIKVQITEVLKPGDLREKSPRFKKAKVKEIKGLKKQKVLKVVPKSEIREGANILGGRFVLEIKNIGNAGEMEKARYVAQGHREKVKPYMVHEISTLRASSIRLILSVAAVKGFSIFSHDVNQAYVQSKDKMTRKIFNIPKKEDLKIIGISEEELLEHMLPLYGVCDAGDYWGVTVELHIEEDLGMRSKIEDPALHLKILDGELERMIGIYVNDNLNAGNKEFESMTEATLEKFDSKPLVYDNFDLFGTLLNTTSPGNFSLSQPRHAERIPLSPKGCSFEAFRKYRAMLSWLSHSRPDLCCIINKCAQVTAETISDVKIRDYNKAVKMMKTEAELGLKCKSLKGGNLVIKVYADAAFATNDDFSSHVGFLVRLCDAEDRAQIVDYSSKNSKRVARFIMGGEVIAFVDGFDKAFVMRRDMEAMLGQKLPLHCFNDSKHLFDAVTREKQTTEKSLMVDFLATREAYKAFEIT